MFLPLKSGIVTIEHIKLIQWVNEEGHILPGRKDDKEEAKRAQIFLGDGLVVMAEDDELNLLRKVIVVNTVNEHLIDEMLGARVTQKIQIVKGDGGVFKNDKR